VATGSDAVRVGRGRKAWVFPVSAFVTGTVLSVGVAFFLSATKTKLPAMAAVDEVSLVLPAGDGAMPTGRTIASEWPERGLDRFPPIRGNVVGFDADAAGPAVVAAGFETGPDVTAAEPAEEVPDAVTVFASDPNTRWFNARPARPARTIWMTVTGYSPDERSCGDSADGLTATMHSVTTNAMKMVAADTSVLPYGSMVSVPGYDTESIVPVLDCGGAIKGDKLDLLFPTHEEALKWGRQRVLVTVWEYVDGKPADNPRKLR
jgi:3D (Asp-Asp-Asp) domain-containing protein